jgi:hypothetical protein
MTGQNLEENLCPACGVPVYPAEAQVAGKWSVIKIIKILSLLRWVHSKHCLIGSWIMELISYWDQIYPDWQVSNYFFITNFTLKLIHIFSAPKW